MENMNIANIIFSVISLSVCIAVFVQALQTGSPNELSSKKYRLLLGLIIFFALFIRLWKFGTVPGGINQDGAMAGVDAKALYEYGTDRFGMRYPVHFTAWGFGQMSVLMSYMMIPFIKLISLNAISLRLPTLISSLMGLAALFLLSRDAYGRKSSLFILFIAAVNPWHIMQSRWALDCNLLPHFFIAGIYLLYKSLNGKIWYLVVSMLCFGLCMYCYGISIYTVTLFLLIAFIWLLSSKRISLKRSFTALAVYLIIAWPFITCMVINAFGLDTIETALFTIPYFPGTIRSGDILFFSDDIPQQLISNLSCTFKLIFQNYTDSLSNMILGFGTMYIFSVPFMIIGFFYTLTSCKKNPVSVLVIILFYVGIIDGAITKNVNANRINIIFYPLIIFCGLGLSFCAERIRYAALPCLIMFFSAFCIFSYTYFTSYADSIYKVFLGDFGQALSSIKDSNYNRVYITPDSQYEGSGHVSRILELYYHDIDAKYYQSDEYSEKYKYIRVKPGDISNESIYIVTENELEGFDPNEFEIRQYGRFYTAVPK